jgi:hypothetical protein
MKRHFLTLVLASAMFSASTAQIEIRTVEELAAIGADNNSQDESYILMNDLTVNNWTPIGGIDGDGMNGFTGTFDGNGHTVTVNSFNAELDNTRVGLFGLIDEKGTVKNLRVAGKVDYTCGQKFLYIGGIAGFNSGLITCCTSSLDLTSNHVKAETKKKVKSQFGYETGQFGGCIAGINLGTVTHCYSTGSIRVLDGQAAGIAAGNGKPVGGSIGISIGSGGGGISVSPGAMPQKTGGIIYCYSTAEVSSSVDYAGKSVLDIVLGGAHGIVATNRIETATMHHCVSLNRLLEAKGKNLKASPFPAIGSAGLTHRNSQFYFYYREDIVTRRYDERNVEQKPSKISPKCAVPLSAMQEESWWRMPDGVNEKDRWKTSGFPFGEDETSPWKWNDILKLPALYWETDIQNEALHETPSEPNGGSLFAEKAKTATTEGELSSDIAWRIEGETLIISGAGEMPGTSMLSGGSQPYADRISAGASVIIEDGITGVCHHAFAASKISSVVLGADVAKLGSYAFFNCNNLVRLEVKSATPPKVGSFAFMSTPIGKAKLIVPAGAKAAYEKAGGWKNFGTIEEKQSE